MRKFKQQFLAGPYLIWIIGFILLPLIMILYYAFTNGDGSFTLSYITAIADETNRKAMGLSLRLGIICTIVCLVLSYPLAMILNNMKIKNQGLVVFIFMLPMWMNFLLRTYACMSILETTGLLNRLFPAIGLIDLVNHICGTELQYFPMINTQGAVVLGMVYNYLPFMILPIYSVIVKLDRNLIEAARDLGANSVQVFRRVILPLSLPGVLSGITMVFVPSVSTFAISKMLGGGTEMLLGDLIEQQYMGGAYNPYLGAAISLVMMVIVVICMVVMNRFGEGEEQAVMM